MANVFVKPEKIVSQGLGLLQRQLLLGRIVTRLGKADFVGSRNDTVDVTVPSVLEGREYEWRTRNSPIEVDDLVEYKLPVRLNKHPYNAVGITDEELTLDIDSWGKKVAAPQVRAVAAKQETYVRDAMANANYRHSVSYAQADPEEEKDREFYRAVNRARTFLNQENVPGTGRKLLLGANVEEAALNSGHLLKANEAAYDGVLREANIGRILGFDVIGMCNSIDPDFAIAFHPTAFALASVAPVVPDGVSAGATLEFDGFAMRWVRDYDADYLRDRSVYSAFAGAESIEDGRDLVEDSPDFGELTEENVRAVKIDFTPFEIGS